MKALIEMLAILITGPMLGVEFGVAAFAHPIFARLPDDAFRAARSDSSRVLGKVMPFWYIAALLLLATAAAVARSWLIGAATALMTAVVVLSVAVLVPINNRIAASSAHESTGGDPSRVLAARWDRLHWLRVTLLAVLFVLLAIGSF